MQRYDLMHSEYEVPSLFLEQYSELPAVVARAARAHIPHCSRNGNISATSRETMAQRHRSGTLVAKEGSIACVARQGGTRYSGD
jgi:hypothetical protein